MRKKLEYKIGDFSRISRISVKTLRYYHEIGLLSPNRIDEDTGYRFYSESCLTAARQINMLKGLDFSLKEIRNILEEYNQDEDLTALFKQKLIETKVKIKEYEKIKKSLEEMIPKDSGKNRGAEVLPLVKTVPDMLIASIRCKDKYGNVGYYMGKIAKKCAGNVCGQPFSLYYDDEYVEEGADIEVCFPINEHMDTPDIKTRMLKGGKFVSLEHKGPYEEIGNAYKKLLDYTYLNGIDIIVPTREIYLKGPGVIFPGNQKKYVTEVQYQIKKLV